MTVAALSQAVYNPTLAVLACQVEPDFNTWVDPDLATYALPIVNGTAMLTFNQKMAFPLVEDPYGGPMTGQVVGMACDIAFDLYLYGIGKSGTVVNSPRWLTNVLGTSGVVVNGANYLTWTPTVGTPTLDGTETNPTFSVKGYFAVQGTPEGTGANDNKLGASLYGCRVASVDFKVVADALLIASVKAKGIWHSNWKDDSVDVSGDLWETTAPDFIRCLGANTKVDGQTAHVSSATWTVDFGTDYIKTDGNIGGFGTAAVGQTKRDVSITCDPLWLVGGPDLMGSAQAGAVVAVETASMIPASQSAASGYGVTLIASACQSETVTINRGGPAVRQGVKFTATRAVSTDAPMTLTIT